VGAASVVLVIALATFSLLSASPHCVGSVNCSLAANAQGPDDTGVGDTTADSGVPATAEPGATLATTSTVPKVPQKYVAIGESVMVGARTLLESAGVFVQAKEGRGPEGVKNAVILLRDAGDIGAGTSIVIQVGTNAPMTASELDAIMAQVPAESGTVYFMTLRADLAYVPDNNLLLEALPAKYPNVQVIDWETASSSVQLCPDGIHISCNGGEPAKFYTNLILANLGLPAIP
jgi:hypothetical protein